MLSQEKRSIIFDETCSGWSKEDGYNLACLRYQERYLQDRLMAQGWLTIADVRTALGAPMVKDIEFYQYGWDYTAGVRLEFEIFPQLTGSSYLIHFLGVTKIM